MHITSAVNAEKYVVKYCLQYLFLFLALSAVTTITIFMPAAMPFFITFAPAGILLIECVMLSFKKTHDFSPLNLLSRGCTALAYLCAILFTSIIEIMAYILRHGVLEALSACASYIWTIIETLGRNVLAAIILLTPIALALALTVTAIFVSISTVSLLTTLTFDVVMALYCTLTELAYDTYKGLSNICDMLYNNLWKQACPQTAPDKEQPVPAENIYKRIQYRISTNASSAQLISNFHSGITNYFKH